VANALFDDRENGDAGEIGEKMFELDDTGFEFAVAGSLGEFFEFESLIEREFADGSAADLAEMRAHAELFSHFVGERADVGAGRTFDDEAGDGPFEFDEAKFEDLDFDRLQFDGLIFSGQFVGRAAVNFFGREGRGHLGKEADALLGKLFESGFVEDRRIVRALRLTFRVVSVGGEAETEAGGVALAAAGIKLNEASGAAEEKYEDACGERIESAEMADLAESGEVADGIDDVVGSFALRLVDDQSAVEGSGLRFAGHGRISDCCLVSGDW